jgi:hypothetical protein
MREEPVERVNVRVASLHTGSACDEISLTQDIQKNNGIINERCGGTSRETRRTSRFNPA